MVPHDSMSDLPLVFKKIYERLRHDIEKKQTLLCKKLQIQFLILNVVMCGTRYHKNWGMPEHYLKMESFSAEKPRLFIFF